MSIAAKPRAGFACASMGLSWVLAMMASLGAMFLSGCASQLSTTTTPSYVLQTSLTAAVFPSTPVLSTSAADTITLSNVGNSTLTISSISLTGTGASVFNLTNGCGSTLAVGATCNVSVTFSPTAAATYQAAITITSNATGSPQAVSLTGTGTITLAATVTPTALDFGNVDIGTTSSAQTVTLANTGNGPITISSILPLGSGAGVFNVTSNCGATLAVGASCQIAVTFSPTATGAAAATLTITDNVLGPPQMVGLTGTGYYIMKLGLSSNTLTFPATPVLGTSSAQAVTVTNTGQAPITLSGIALSGSSSAAFAETAGSAECKVGATLAVGATCTLTYVLAPPCTGANTFTAGSPTQYTAMVSVTDNATNSPQTFNLAGQGLSSATATMTPGTIYWGADGHLDKGDPNYVPSTTGTGVCTQIKDLKTVFGSTPDTIFYRMADSVQDTGGSIPAAVQELQSAGILPIVGAVTYPSALLGWSSVTPSSYASGYSWAYALVKADAQAAPGNVYWFVGNEWNGQISQQTSSAYPSDPTNPALWQALPAYPSYLGAMAGAIHAIREVVPNAVVIAGSIGDTISYGLPLALQTDLATHGEHWDYTGVHWSNGYANQGFAESPGYYYYNGTATLRNLYTTLNATGAPLFFDEFGAGNGDTCSNTATTYDAATGTATANLMTEMLARARAATGTKGIVGATYYQLYPEPGLCSYATDMDRYLFTAPGTIAAQGTAVKNWIAANGTGVNPTVAVAANYSLTSTNVTIASPGSSGTSTVKLTSGTGFTGSVTLTCFVWNELQTDPTTNPTCSFPSAASSATVSGSGTTTVTVKSLAASAIRNYVVTVVGTSAGAVTETSFTANVK